jgi:hypothetical protein
MAEYYLDEKGQIYGDLAFRLGNIIKQYDTHIKKQDPLNFDSSLCICILQNLLTIYDEEFPKWNGYPISRGDIYYNPNTRLSLSNYFNLEKKLIIKNTFGVMDDTVGSFLKHLRNSLSHPTRIARDQANQSTGYYSISDSSQGITGYVFIDSPDILNNSPRSFDNQEKYNIYCRKNRGFYFENKIVNGKIIISNPRVFKIQLSNDQLKELTLNLAKFIAQPIQKHWDGLLFNDNILEYAA